MTTIIKAKDGTELDLGVVTLAKAIRQVESSNNYNSKGASGESGAYQFMPSSWKEWAKKYLGNENAEMSSVNQDKVAYYRIKELKDAGNSPSQVASIWNSGSPVWEGKIGTNSKGVKYNVPAYVEKVKNEYINYKQLALATLPSAQIETTNTSNTTEQPGFVQSLAQSIAKPFEQIIATGITGLKGITNYIGAGIDTLLGNKELAKIQTEEAKNPVKVDLGYLGNANPIGMDDNGNYLSGKETAKQVAGVGLEVAATLLPYGKVASVGEKVLSKVVSTGLSKVGGNVVASALGGYMYETGSDLSEEKTVADSFMPGGGTLLATIFPIGGAVTSAVGKKAINSTSDGMVAVWNKASDVLEDILPSWLKNKLPSEVKENIQSAINSKIVISSKGLVNAINKKIATFNSASNDFFNKNGGKERISKNDIVRATQNRDVEKLFSDKGYKTTEDILKAVAKVVPEAAGILTSNKVWTMAEASRLRNKMLKAILESTENSTELKLARSIFTTLNYFMVGKTANIIKNKAGRELTQEELQVMVNTFNNINEITKNYRLLFDLKTKVESDSISLYNIFNNFLSQQFRTTVGGAIGYSQGGVVGAVAGAVAGEIIAPATNTFRFFITPEGRIVATNNAKIIKQFIEGGIENISKNEKLKAGIGAAKELKDAVKSAVYKETSDEIKGEN